MASELWLVSIGFLLGVLVGGLGMMVISQSCRSQPDLRALRVYQVGEPNILAVRAYNEMRRRGAVSVQEDSQGVLRIVSSYVHYEDSHHQISRVSIIDDYGNILCRLDDGDMSVLFGWGIRRAVTSLVRLAQVADSTG